MKKILLINPGIKGKNESPNRGDGIISRASFRQIKELFPDSDIFQISSHEYPSPSDIKWFIQSDYIFVGGSNLLWFRFFPSASWKLGLIYLLFARKLVLLGVGWGSYEIPTNLWGKLVCKLILSKRKLHSVRDSYTLKKLNALGIKNVINTGCHTTWNVNSNSYISLSNRDSILFTLTDYRRNETQDLILFNLLKRLNKKIYFWVQGSKDLEYFSILKLEANILNFSSIELVDFLDKNNSNFIYIGTRLHCGMVCLEFNIPTVIINVDNRSKEMGKDLSFNNINREDLHLNLDLEKIISNNNFQIRSKEILEWKENIKL
jgi:polysaccharide pyruvyl transferase WcaK-like protein